MPIITARGIGVVIVSIIVFVLATYTRVGWLYMFDAVLWGTSIISFIMPWLAIGRLDVKRRVLSWERSTDIPGPMQGDPVVMDVRFKNTSRLPCMFVTAQYNCGQPVEGQKAHLFIAWLARNSSANSSTTVSFSRRGVHRLGPVKVQTRVPFGLFRKTRIIEDPVEIVILPKVYPFSDLDLIGNEGESNPYPLQARVGELVIGSRNYLPGDPWQHIHWRNTARLSITQIKEFERSPDSSVVIGLDIKRSQSDYDQALEEAVTIAASVGDFICRSWGVVRLVTDQLSQQTSNRFQLLTELALVEGSQESILSSLPANISPFSDIVAVVLDTDIDGIDTLAMLSRGQHRVTAILMRGYSQISLPSRPAESLNSAGVNVVECWPGDVEAALSSLKRVTGNSQGAALTTSGQT